MSIYQKKYIILLLKSKNDTIGELIHILNQEEELDDEEYVKITYIRSICLNFNFENIEEDMKENYRDELNSILNDDSNISNHDKKIIQTMFERSPDMAK